MPKQVSLGPPKGYVQIQGLNAEDIGIEAKGLDNTTVYNMGTPGSYFITPFQFSSFSYILTTQTK